MFDNINKQDCRGNQGCRGGEAAPSKEDKGYNGLCLLEEIKLSLRRDGVLPPAADWWG